VNSPRVTPKTVQLVDRLFPPEHREEVCEILARECGDNLPLTGPPAPGRGHERIRFAALKISGGDLAKLRQAVDYAKIDWRDVLVGAGFGNSLTAHQEWARAVLNSPPSHA
jgi:hypothetical protein